jgi:hypothetical protein
MRRGVGSAPDAPTEGAHHAHVGIVPARRGKSQNTSQNKFPCSGPKNSLASRKNCEQMAKKTFDFPRNDGAHGGTLVRVHKKSVKDQKTNNSSCTKV